MTTRTSVSAVGSYARTKASRTGLLLGSFRGPRMTLGFAPPVKPRTWKSAVVVAPSVTVTGAPVPRETAPHGKKLLAVPLATWLGKTSTTYWPGGRTRALEL